MKDLDHLLSAISAKKGERSRPSASASMATASFVEASWITQTFGQNVVSRRNSVSTVTKAIFREGLANGRQFAGICDKAHEIFIIQGFRGG